MAMHAPCIRYHTIIETAMRAQQVDVERFGSIPIFLSIIIEYYSNGLKITYDFPNRPNITTKSVSVYPLQS